MDKPSKEEYAVAKWMKKNVRTKKTKFLSHNVEYFTATKALDALLKSKFAEGDNCLFPTREAAIEFLDVMLEHKFFHRAKKVPVFPEEMKGKAKKTGEKDTPLKKEVKEEKPEKATDADSSHVEGNTTEEAQTKEKRKRKIKLDMHADQVFVDGSEAYVWIYDPVPIHYWIYGLILVLGAIVICLFPLWPPLLRKGVYYLSIAAAGFLVFILALTVIRLIVFVIVWILSGGKLYFWIFPNLTEDVGFLASFWPLYESEYHSESDASKSKKAKKKKKDKDSDAEEEAPLEPEKIENIKENETGSVVDPQLDEEKEIEESKPKPKGEESPKKSKDDASSEAKDATTFSESESEGSRSSTGKDFELVDATEVET